MGIDHPELNALLRSLPEPQKRALQCCVDVARERDDFSLGIFGSVASGECDEYSDLDLVCVRDPPGEARLTAEQFGAITGRIGDVLVQFDASHLGRSNMYVAYITHQGRMVKVDASMIVAGDVLALPTLPIKLHDPENRFGRVTFTVDVSVDARVLLEKMCGWLWYSFARIARGEYFAGARAIDYARENALLPVILHRLGFPQGGHRRIESRLPEALVTALRETHPDALEKDKLLACLEALYVLTRQELQLQENAFPHLPPILERVWEHIQASMQTISTTPLRP